MKKILTFLPELIGLVFIIALLLSGCKSAKHTQQTKYDRFPVERSTNKNGLRQ